MKPTTTEMGLNAPQQIIDSHWRVPFTAVFNTRRKIGAFRSEHCDAWPCGKPFLHKHLINVLFPSACIRLSGTTISDLQNSRDPPNTSNCGTSKICWRCGGTHEHIGMAGSHGTAQFRSNLPSKGFWARGLSWCSGAGEGQPVKPRTCRAGGGWVGGECIQPQGHEPNKLE